MVVIHSGDLHLGTAFAACSSYMAAERRKKQAVITENLIKLIAETKAGLVLLSGDVFDTDQVSADTVDRFFAALGELGDVRFVIAPGNHDFYEEGGIYDLPSIPGNVFVFKSGEMSFFDFPDLNTRVYGYAFTSASMKYFPSCPSLDSSKINILCCHGSLDDPLSAYCPISSSELGGIGFDYAALGHIHQMSVKRAGKTVIAYSGCLMGRDFGECGEKGVLQVAFSGKSEPKTVFRTLCHERYMTVDVDISGADGMSAVADRVRSAVSEIEDHGSILLRVGLTGLVSFDLIIDTSAIEKIISPDFMYVEVKNGTSVTLPADYLENDKTLKGFFYRELKDGLNSPDPAVRKKYAEAFALGIRAMNGEELV